MITPIVSLICQTGLTFCQVIFAAILVQLLRTAGQWLAGQWKARRLRKAQLRTQRALYAQNLRRI